MSPGATRVTTCANRSRASAYGLIDPDTSSSSTTRRGRVARRCRRGRTGSPPAASMSRTVCRRSTSPRRAGARRSAGRRGGTGASWPMSSARCARSAADSVAMSRCRSTSVSSAATARAGPAPLVSCASALRSAATRDWRGWAGRRVARGIRSPNQASKARSKRGRSSGSRHSVAWAVQYTCVMSARSISRRARVNSSTESVATGRPAWVRLRAKPAIPTSSALMPTAGPVRRAPRGRRPRGTSAPHPGWRRRSRRRARHGRVRATRAPNPASRRRPAV